MKASGGGNLGSSWKGEKFPGGDIDNHGDELKSLRLDLPPSRLRPSLATSLGPCVKSPLCNAERGRSICRPARLDSRALPPPA